MNRLYLKFVERHPSFLESKSDHMFGKPKVGQCHVYAHSLGSVIIADVACYHHVDKYNHTKDAAVGHSKNASVDYSPVDLSDLALNLSQS